MNTHRNVVFATSVYERWIGLTNADVILGLAPLFHVTGLIGHVALTLLTGAPLVLFYRFDVAEACMLVEVYRATFTVSAVTAFIALLNSGEIEKRNLASLKKVYTGGAPTPTTVLDDWYARTRRAHPADVRPDGSDIAHSHDPARGNPAHRSSYGRHVDRRARVQHAREGNRRKRRGVRATRDWRIRDCRPADRPGLLAEPRGHDENDHRRRTAKPAMSASWTRTAGSTS